MPETMRRELRELGLLDPDIVNEPRFAKPGGQRAARSGLFGRGDRGERERMTRFEVIENETGKVDLDCPTLRTRSTFSPFLCGWRRP